MSRINDEITIPALLEHAAEECTELAQACLKLARLLRDENPVGATEDELTEKLLEEIADVLNMLNVMRDKGLWDNKRIAGYMAEKMDRWHKRLSQKGNA